MNVIKVKRGHAKGILTRAAAFADTVDANTTLSMLEIRLSKLKDAWSDFVSLQNQLYDLVDSPDFVNPEPEFEEYETKYFIAHSILTSFIKLKNKCEPPKESIADKLASQQATLLEKLNSTTTSTSSSSVNLPKITIPSFSGDYKDWPGFRDLFLGSIDCNASLSPTQKFYFLKSFVSGKAADLIRHITISESNYIEAWDKLERRFDRTQLIVQSFIQSFLSLPSTTSCNVTVLRKITDGADEVIRGLNALESNSRDPWVVYLLLQKLDPETKQAWAEHVALKDDFTINEMLDFLQNRCVCLESCYSSSHSSQSRSKVQGSIRSHVVESKQCCSKCKGDHNLYNCKNFLALSIDSRRHFVKEKSLCFNCLREGHNSNRCRSSFRCKSCHSKHHSLVHQGATRDSSTSPNANASTNSTASSSSSSLPSSSCSSSSSSQDMAHIPVVNNHSCEPNRQTILPTAIAKTLDNQNSSHSVRLLLDTGSQVSFITEQAVRRLGLTRNHSRIPVLGVASTSAGVTNGIVSVRLTSRFGSEFIDISCYVLSKLTSSLPPSLIENLDLSNLVSVELADPQFYRPGPIDILIGADRVFSIITGPAKSDLNGIPNLIPTIFGSVVAGKIASPSLERIESLCTQLDYSQEFDLEKFWRLEEIEMEPPLSLDDQRAEQLYASTHKRLSDGR